MNDLTTQLLLKTPKSKRSVFRRLRYAELVAIPDKSAVTVVSTIFSIGLCRQLQEFMSDNGTEFCNQIIEQLLKLLDIKKQPPQPTILSQMHRQKSATRQ